MDLRAVRLLVEPRGGSARRLPSAWVVAWSVGLGAGLFVASGCASGPDDSVVPAVERARTEKGSADSVEPEAWLREGLEAEGRHRVLAAMMPAPRRDVEDGPRAVVIGGGQEADEDLDSLEEDLSALDLDIDLGDDGAAAEGASAAPAEKAPGAADSTGTSAAPAEKTPAGEKPAGTSGGVSGDDLDLDLDSLLEDAGGADTPSPEEAAPPARRSSPAPGRRSSSATVAPGDVLREMGLRGQARKAEAAELLKQAQAAILRRDLARAEELLDRSVQLDPSEEAESRLVEVRQLLGDPRAEVATTARDYMQQAKLEREMMVTEIRRALAEAHAHEAVEEYDRAILLYKRAIDIIRTLPFDVRLDDELRAARSGLESAQRLKVGKEEKEKQDLLRLIDQEKRAELKTSFDIVENQIRDLHRRARGAVEAKDYERAATLYDQIVKLNVHDEVALRGRARANRLAHIKRMNEALHRSIDNYELAVVGVEESSIIYQQIFRYPERDEWIRISPKVIDIASQVAQTESARDKEVRRALDRSISFGVPDEVPLKDVLAELQTLSSGVNFFVSAGEGDNPGEKPVQLDQLDNLPLRNVLNLLLEKAGEDLGYIVKDGAVVIGPKDSLQEPVYFRSYEISDLIRARPNFEAPDLALDELAGKQESGGGLELDTGLGGEEEGGGPVPRDELLRIIGKELTGSADEEPEGINIYGGKLSATVSLEDHLKIAKILERFRRSTGMMVTVESRFLDIQDNFLEEIGVNFGGSNSNLPNNIPDADGAGTALAPGYEFIDARGEFNLRAATIGAFSNPLGSQVNPFNLSSAGGGAWQINVLDAERFQLEAILTGVGKEQEVRRLNSPRVTAFNTQTAHTLVVEQAAFIQDLEVNQTGVIPVINPVIGVLNTGSILELRPTISYDRKYVVLEIQPTLAEEIGRNIAVLNLSGNFTVVPVQLPILSVTKIKTTVTVPDGGTVLVGGLKREVTTKNSIGLPFVRHIPILNILWGRRGTSNLRSNLFVLINAQITIVHEEEEKLLGGI